jgi:hypothetical protein
MSSFSLILLFWFCIPFYAFFLIFCYIFLVCALSLNFLKHIFIIFSNQRQPSAHPGVQLDQLQEHPATATPLQHQHNQQSVAHEHAAHAHTHRQQQGDARG